MQGVQECGVNPSISDCPHCRLQHLQCATSSQQRRTGHSEPRPCRHGARSPLRHDRDWVRDLPRLSFVNVTMPAPLLEAELKTGQVLSLQTCGLA
jgi:hypothetical protein